MSLKPIWVWRQRSSFRTTSAGKGSQLLFLCGPSVWELGSEEHQEPTGLMYPQHGMTRWQVGTQRSSNSKDHLFTVFWFFFFFFERQWTVELKQQNKTIKEELPNQIVRKQHAPCPGLKFLPILCLSSGCPEVFSLAPYCSPFCLACFYGIKEPACLFHQGTHFFIHYVFIFFFFPVLRFAIKSPLTEILGCLQQLWGFPANCLVFLRVNSL